MTWGELVRDSLQIANLVPLGQDAVPELNAAARRALPLLLSEWSRDGLLGPFTSEISANLVGGTNQYTLGTGGNFTKRPLDVYQVVITGSTLGLVRIPIMVRPWSEFQALTFPSALGVPRRAYFNLTYPLAAMGLYPTPQNPYTCKIVCAFPWDAIDFDAQVSLPSGFDSAVMDNLAVRTCENLNRFVTADLRNRARDGKTGCVLATPTPEVARNNKLAARLASPSIRNWQADTPA